jgi:ESCRT-I complex subunit TSG101
MSGQFPGASGDPAYPLQTYYKPPPPLPAPAPPPATPGPPAVHPPAPAPNFMDADDVPPYASSSSAPTTPARPPNPELLALHARVHSALNNELASLTHAMALDADRLRAHQADLLAGPPAIADERARLCAVRDVCTAVAGRLRDAVNAAEAQVTELRRRGEPSVDELVCATTIVHNQYVGSIAFPHTAE